MRAVLTIILISLIFCGELNSQTRRDYFIYGLVIENLFNELDPDLIYSDNVVVFDKYNSSIGWLKNSINDIDHLLYKMEVDSSAYDTIQTILNELSLDFNNSQRLEADSFQISIQLSVMSYSSFEKLFRKNKVEKGWKRFYREYPKSVGVFGFTKIIYSDEYACLFADFKRNGLFASGDIIVLRRVGNKWEILNKINIYKA